MPSGDEKFVFGGQRCPTGTRNSFLEGNDALRGREIRFWRATMPSARRRFVFSEGIVALISGAFGFAPFLARGDWLAGLLSSERAHQGLQPAE